MAKIINKKICVVGAGRWGINHVNTLYKLNCLGGVVEKNTTIVKDIKKKCKDIIFFTDLDSAIEYGFDGFVVATPAETHFEIAKKIIESNNHVLVEKPITTTLQDAVVLNNLAKLNKVNLMVGHVLLFHPAFRKIKEMITNNVIGDLQYMYSNRLNLGTIRTHENVLWSFAPHDIALFQFFSNLKPKDVNCIGSDILQKGIHDTTITTIEYPGNIMGHIFVSWLHPFKEHRFVVVGSKGMIHFEDSKDGKPLIFYDKNIEWKENIPIAKNGSSELISFNNELPLESELKYFINHLNGKELSISNGDSAIDVMAIITKATNKLLEKSI
mgnify:CR=1 FL=1